MAKAQFTELANAQISDKRRAVISKLEGSYTIGQKVEVSEGNKTMHIFLKGAIHIDTIEGVQRLRDALNLVLKQEQK